VLTAIRIVTAVTSLVVVPSVVPVATADAPAARVVLTDMTSAERRATQETLSLFDQAGLPLPPLQIRRHHDIEHCHGFEGLHRRFDGRSVIDVFVT
jgi:hypothetical protein